MARPKRTKKPRTKRRQRGRRPTVKAKVKPPKPSPHKMVRQFFTVFEESARMPAYNLMRSMASKVAHEVKRAIEHQDGAGDNGYYEWPPLSHKYFRWKLKKGHDERILIQTGFYLKNIQWWMTKTGVHVGVRNIQHPTAKMSLILLARIHEFGFGNVPPRPHWRTAWAIVLAERPKLRRAYFDLAKSELSRRLNRRRRSVRGFLKEMMPPAKQ
jgi:hypothetical protein